MGTTLHGKGGLVYVSGVEIGKANSWSLTITQDSVETPIFGDSYKIRVVGLADWNGNITAWLESDSKVITNAATAGVAVAILLYPQRTDLTDFFSGNAIFGATLSTPSGGAITRDGNFVGAGALTITGFT